MCKVEQNASMTPFHRALAHTLAAEGYYTDSDPAGWEGIRA